MSLIIVLLLLNVLLVANAHNDIFSTKAKMEMRWITDNGNVPLSVQEIFHLEQIVGPFLHPQLTVLVAAEDKEALSTRIDITDQEITLTSSNSSVATSESVQSATPTTTLYNYSLEAQVTFLYLGHTVIDNFAFLLAKASLDGLQEVLSFDIQAIDADATSFVVAFTLLDEETKLIFEIPTEDPLPRHTTADKGLIAACAFLVVALCFVSSILLFVAGGCDSIKSRICCCGRESAPYGTRRKRNRKNISESESTKSGMAVLGAKGVGGGGNEDSKEMPTSFTPSKSIYRDDDEDSEFISPMSQATDLSSRIVPLGIISSRKLQGSPEKSSYLPNFQVHQKLNYS